MLAASSRPIDSTRLLSPGRSPAHRAVNRSRLAVGRLQIDTNPGADRRSIRPGPDQLDLQPVSLVARVAEQEVWRRVPGHDPSGLDEEVEVAVLVEVGEGHAVPVLEAARARGDRHLLESESGHVLEHPVGDQSRVGSPARPHVEIEIAVVVEVAETARQSGHRPVQADLRGDIAEALGAQVTVESQPAGGLDPAAQRGRHEVGRNRPTLADIEVLSAVVVEVPEPACGTRRRSRPRREGATSTNLP